MHLHRAPEVLACRRCGRAIVQGDWVEWSPDAGNDVHATCVELSAISSYSSSTDTRTTGNRACDSDVSNADQENAGRINQPAAYHSLPQHSIT